MARVGYLQRERLGREAASVDGLTRLLLTSAWSSNRLVRRLAQRSLYLPDAVNEALRRAVFEECLFRKNENAEFNSNRGPLMRLFYFAL